MTSREKESLRASFERKGLRYYTKEEEECCVPLMETEFDSHSKAEDGISWYKAMFLTMNAALGAGLLNFPRAFHDAGGLVPGNMLHMVVTVLALISLLIIANCAVERRCNTYQELILHMCGRRWNVVASVCIFAYCMVTCITLLIIIGDQFDRAFASFAGSDFCAIWFMNRKFTLTASAIMLIFPSCLKRMDALRFLSYAGVLTIFYVTVIITEEYYTGGYARRPLEIYDADWVQMFNVLPTICFGYQCHISSVPIYSCVKQSQAKSTWKACTVAIAVCLLVYTVSANYGYLTFGSLVNTDVLLSYEARRPQVLVAVVLLAVKSWTTYPILLFCMREAVNDMYLRVRSLPESAAEKGEPTRRKLIAIALWGLTVLFAVFLPNIGIVMKILGSLAALFIFVFPGMCVLQVADEFVPSRKVAFDTWKKRGMVLAGSLYLTVGGFAFGLALSLGVEGLVSPEVPVSACGV
ncbi:putative sodium-coupled neutral amino acid transporter 7 [Penaeus monodon]|uniref:putative sodium-coupled neutral amino acid transporter 7 n=1 Tax=Penaeus monodon TaxID=6687 RepID=UPI0018A74D38|nr:putative sodium-coupled neutral amino acid transporter 7 [Penaeus monodon]